MGALAMQVERSAGWLGYGAMLVLLAAVLGGLGSPSAQAERIENATANFAALDKVSAKKEELPIRLNETEKFRTLRITPRICLTSDPSEPPRTSTFVEVDEILFDGSVKRIFSGWMFAESPGLNPLVHPVFDIWLTGCSQPKTAVTSKVPGTDAPVAPAPKPAPKRPRPPR
jgi:hypothetical protein